jgi:hypothetical protein
MAKRTSSAAVLLIAITLAGCSSSTAPATVPPVTAEATQVDLSKLPRQATTVAPATLAPTTVAPVTTRTRPLPEGVTEADYAAVVATVTAYQNAWRDALLALPEYLPNAILDLGYPGTSEAIEQAAVVKDFADRGARVAAGNILQLRVDDVLFFSAERAALDMCSADNDAFTVDGKTDASLGGVVDRFEVRRLESEWRISAAERVRELDEGSACDDR